MKMHYLFLMKIERLHDFADLAYASEWSKKFKPAGERLRLFQTVQALLTPHTVSGAHVLELGIGPGYLAMHLLEHLPNITYEGFDSSQAMLLIAATNLEGYADRIRFTAGDLLADDWTEHISEAPQIVLSTWALHDLFTIENIAAVYRNVHALLRQGGLFINGDFIKPELSEFEYEGGRIKPSQHLTLLSEMGFKGVQKIADFEVDVHAPTPANNYSVFVGRV